MWGYEGTTKNAAEALRLYRQAAALGFSDAQMQLAASPLRGRATPEYAGDQFAAKFLCCPPRGTDKTKQLLGLRPVSTFFPGRSQCSAENCQAIISTPINVIRVPRMRSAILSPKKSFAASTVNSVLNRLIAIT